MCLQDTKPTTDDAHWLESCIEEAHEQTKQAIVNQQKFEAETQTKEQEELDSYFAAIRLKKQINASQAGGGKNSQQDDGSQHQVSHSLIDQ